MPAGVHNTALLRVAAIAAAASLLAIPAAYVVGMWSLGDHALHDTYYAVAGAQRMALVAFLAIVHQLGAMVCAILSATRTRAALAGWLLCSSGLLLAAVELVVALAPTLFLRPRRYVDYSDSFQVISSIGQYGVLVAIVGLAAGWLVLAFSSPRPASGAEV